MSNEPNEDKLLLYGPPCVIGLLVLTVYTMCLGGCFEKEGYKKGKKDMEKEAIKNGAATYIVNEKNELELKWTTTPKGPSNHGKTQDSPQMP